MKIGILQHIFGKGKMRHFETASLVETLQGVQEQLDNEVKDVVNQVRNTATSLGWQDDKEYKVVVDWMVTNYKYPKHLDKNIWSIFDHVIHRIEGMLDDLVDLCRAQLGEGRDRDHMTYRDVQLLSWVNAIVQTVNFMPTCIRYFVLRQIELSGGEKVKSALTPNDLKEYQSGLATVYVNLGILSQLNPKTLSKDLENVAEIEVTEEERERRVVADRDIDPKGILSGFAVSNFNPFFLWLNYRSEIRYAKYKRNKEECASLVMEITSLEDMIRYGNTDVHTQKSLEAIRDRLTRLKKQVADYEISVTGRSYV